MSKTRFCTECGAPVAAGARFCVACGSGIRPLPQSTEAPTPALPQPRPPTDPAALAAFAAAVLWLFGAGTVAAIFLGHRSRRRIGAAAGRLGGELWALAALATAYGTLAAGIAAGVLFALR